MKFFDAIKKLFSKDIKVKQDISQYLIYPLRLKRGKIWLNSKIQVPENFVAVITHKKRVLDFLPAGEHSLTPLSLPLCKKRFRLHIADKDGKLIKNFKAKTLLINLAQQKNFKSAISRKLKYKTSVDGKFWVKPSFEIDFCVNNAQKFLQTLLKNSESAWNVRKPKYVNQILSGLFEISLFKLLRKENYLIASFKQNKKYLANALLPKFNKVADKYGVNITEMQVCDVIFSKRALAVEKLREQRSIEATTATEFAYNTTTEKRPLVAEVLTGNKISTETTQFTEVFWSGANNATIKSDTKNLSQPEETFIQTKSTENVVDFVPFATAENKNSNFERFINSTVVDKTNKYEQSATAEPASIFKNLETEKNDELEKNKNFISENEITKTTLTSTETTFKTMANAESENDTQRQSFMPQTPDEPFTSSTSSNKAKWQGLESFNIGQVVAMNDERPSLLSKSKQRRFVQLLEQ